MSTELAVAQAGLPKKMVTQEDVMRTKEWLWCVAYVENKFNLAAASRAIFKLGSKGGKKKNESSTASEMGRRMLIKPEVQQYLKALMHANGAGVHNALYTLTEVMRQKRDVPERRRAAEDILKHHGEFERNDTANPVQRHVHLVVPERPPDIE